MILSIQIRFVCVYHIIIKKKKLIFTKSRALEKREWYCWQVRMLMGDIIEMSCVSTLSRTPTGAQGARPPALHQYANMWFYSQNFQRKIKLSISVLTSVTPVLFSSAWFTYTDFLKVCYLSSFYCEIVNIKAESGDRWQAHWLNTHIDGPTIIECCCCGILNVKKSFTSIHNFMKRLDSGKIVVVYKKHDYMYGCILCI